MGYFGNTFQIQNMDFLREEKEKMVLDLYYQGNNTRVIAQRVHLSFRDIGAIVDNAEKQKEEDKNRSQQSTLSTRAYKLFADGKTPVQVAIQLNVRQPEVEQFYREYWKLNQQHTLCQIHGDIKDDLGPFLELYGCAKAAGLDTNHVVRLLTIGNKDLPRVERVLGIQQGAVNILTSEKRKLEGQLVELHETMFQYHKSHREELDVIYRLREEKQQLERVVSNLASSNEDKIKKICKYEVENLLADKKTLLKLALRSVIDSLKINYGDSIYEQSNSQGYNFTKIDDEVVLIESGAIYNKKLEDVAPNCW